MQNNSEKKKQEIKCKNIDRRKAKRWSNRMQKHRLKKNKGMVKLNAKT
jgi:hypothetical protein